MEYPESWWLFHERQLGGSHDTVMEVGEEATAVTERGGPEGAVEEEEEEEEEEEKEQEEEETIHRVKKIPHSVCTLKLVNLICHTYLYMYTHMLSH